MSRLTVTGELRRAEIIDAAAALFDDHGFHGASTSAIAERSGTAKATVYHYFRSKHDLLFAIHEEWIDGLIDGFRARERDIHDPVELLHQVFRDLLALIDAKPGHVRVFFECYRELPDDLLAEARTKRDLYEGLVEDTLLRGMRDGTVAWQDPRTATFGLFGMCNWAYQWYRPDGALTHTEIADRLFSIFRDGVTPRNPA
jgi:TetR/AcrR family transcriptional regulator, cholesterol catabolism regulator